MNNILVPSKSLTDYAANNYLRKLAANLQELIAHWWHSYIDSSYIIGSYIGGSNIMDSKYMDSWQLQQLLTVFYHLVVLIWNLSTCQPANLTFDSFGPIS